MAEETQTTSGGPTISRRFIVDDTGRAIKLSVAGDPVGANNGTYVIVWNGHGDATGLWRIKTDGTLEKASTFTYDTWGRPARTVYGPYTDLGFRYLYVGAADVQWDDAYAENSPVTKADASGRASSSCGDLPEALQAGLSARLRSSGAPSSSGSSWHRSRQRRTIGGIGTARLDPA